MASAGLGCDGLHARESDGAIGRSRVLNAPLGDLYSESVEWSGADG
jgi:hypothetical protein